MIEDELPRLGAAVVLGLGFGVCLERAGLGDARKLTAQFRFTDLTVTRVLFTALVTATLGVFWLDRTGVLDVDALFVPPAHGLPQVLGGLVFGAGLALAGLCPGTACVALASGRVDGLVVMAGILGGVLVFHESWFLLEDLYGATPLDSDTVDGLLGLPYGVTVFLVVLLALAAFRLAGSVERRARATS
jgi:hypothetical protein